MRQALLIGGLTSFVLVAALLLATPSDRAGLYKRRVRGRRAVHPRVEHRQRWLTDILLLLVIFAFFSCGSSVQGAGARLAFSFARDGAVPGSSVARRRCHRVSTRRSTRCCSAPGAGRCSPCWFNLTPEGEAHRLHHLPGESVRVDRPGVVRGQRHLPVVPAHRDRGDRRETRGWGRRAPSGSVAGGGR